MNAISAIGFSAGTLSALIFLPQMLKTVKTKNTKDLSLVSFILLTITNSLWMAYAILTGDNPIILSQAFLLPMGATIMIYKWIYK